MSEVGSYVLVKNVTRTFRPLFFYFYGRGWISPKIWPRFLITVAFQLIWFGNKRTKVRSADDWPISFLCKFVTLKLTQLWENETTNRLQKKGPEKFVKSSITQPFSARFSQNWYAGALRVRGTGLLKPDGRAALSGNAALIATISCFC